MPNESFLAYLSTAASRYKSAAFRRRTEGRQTRLP